MMIMMALDHYVLVMLNTLKIIIRQYLLNVCDKKKLIKTYAKI